MRKNFPPFAAIMFLLVSQICHAQNVGVGTPAPQQNLSVNKGLNIDQSNSNTGSSANALTFGSSSGEGMGSNRVAGTNLYGLDIYTNNTNRMCVTNSGKIGIGITNPASKFEIRGGALGLSTSTKLWEINYDSIAAYFYIDEFGAGRRLTIKNGGNVGIGTTNPTTPLEVAGDIKTSGNIIVQNDKSVIRSNSSSAQKLITFSGSYANTIPAFGVLSAPVGFESFSAPPTISVAQIGSGTGDFFKVYITCTGVTNGGCTVNFYNASNASITFSGTFNFIAVGAQ